MEAKFQYNWKKPKEREVGLVRLIGLLGEWSYMSAVRKNLSHYRFLGGKKNDDCFLYLDLHVTTYTIVWIAYASVTLTTPSDHLQNAQNMSHLASKD